MCIRDRFSIFSDKNKAIAFCLARFDDDTKEAFLNLYTKVDADMQVGDTIDDDDDGETVTASAEGNKCPF